MHVLSRHVVVWWIGNVKLLVRWSVSAWWSHDNDNIWSPATLSQHAHFSSLRPTSSYTFINHAAERKKLKPKLYHCQEMYIVVEAQTKFN